MNKALFLIKCSLVAVTCLAGTAFADQQKQTPAETNKSQQAQAVKPDSDKEIIRLKKVIAAKDNALDVAISEIKKYSERGSGSSTDPKVFTENSGMKEAFQLNGWDVAEFSGVGDVQAKSLRDVTIFKVHNKQSLQAAKDVLTPKARAYFACGNGAQCYIIANSQLMVPASSAK